MSTNGVYMYHDIKDKDIHIRISSEDYERIKKVAESVGVSVSFYLRSLALGEFYRIYGNK